VKRILGIVLLAGAGCILGVSAWLAIAMASEPTIAQLWGALNPVASMPLATLESSQARLEGQIPATRDWSAVVASLGSPRFWVGPVTPSTVVSRHTYTRSEVPFSVVVTIDGHAVEAQPADLVPYGYSAEDLNGYIFEAVAGQRISATVTSPRPLLPPGEVVVIPVWQGYAVLDHANGALAMQELSPLFRWLVGAGLLACLAGVAILWGGRLKRRRLTTE
jgi:hypothetical protein